MNIFGKEEEEPQVDDTRVISIVLELVLELLTQLKQNLLVINLVYTKFHQL